MPDYETFDLGDFKLQNGETLPGAFIGKQTACVSCSLRVNCLRTRTIA